MQAVSVTLIIYYVKLFSQQNISLFKLGWKNKKFQNIIESKNFSGKIVKLYLEIRKSYRILEWIGLPWQSFVSSSIRSSMQTIRVVRGCRVPFNNELSNLENSPTADAAPFHRYKSLASLVKSAPRDRRQFKCTPWMKEWWRYTKRKERGQPGRARKRNGPGLAEGVVRCIFIPRSFR